MRPRPHGTGRLGPVLVAVGLAVASVVPAPALGAPEDVWDRVEHHYADNDGVRIHYVTLGQGEPVVFLHGFPDFWYTWSNQMAALESDFQAIAIDLRGYNQSDKPQGVENYRRELLYSDVTAVLDDLGHDQVTLVGHDWGGGIAWRYTMLYQDRIKRLVILNLTHPTGAAAVLANPTEEQRANTQYRRDFGLSEPQGDPIPERMLRLGYRLGDETVGRHYEEAMGRSYYDGMVNYYRASYRARESGTVPPPIADITCPVLQFHGLDDTAVDKDGLRDTWNWIAADYTLVTVPGAGHWVQWEAADLVSETMKWWLLARR